MRRPAMMVVIVLCCTFFVGCYQKQSTGGGVVVTFQAWVPIALGLAGILAIPAGILIFAQKKRYGGLILAIIGPLIAAAVAPGMYMDKVVVKDDGFYSQHGFWWSPTTHDVHYDDLRQVAVTVEEKQGRRGKTYSYYFDCLFKSGRQERIPVGDLMKEALSDIVDQFKKHSIPLQVPPNLPE